MHSLRFADIITDCQTDRFGRITGQGEFPCLNRRLRVVCHEGVTPEYAAKSLQWLAAVDGEQLREICQCALYYLQDQLESTSVGELLDEGARHIQDPLEVLRYMSLWGLDIKPPQDPDLPVLNLCGSCAWREDEGLQCLLRNGHVVYLGTWNDWDVWDGRLADSGRYLGNYALYPRWEELRQKAAKEPEPRRIPHLEFAMSSPIRHAVEVLIAREEHCSWEQAWEKLEGTRLMELLQEDPALAWASEALLHQCFRMERDQGAVEMEVYLWEQTHQD